jgi:hypothetical protein
VPTFFGDLGGGAERLNPESHNTDDLVSDSLELIAPNYVRRQPLVDSSLKNIREFIDSVSFELDMLTKVPPNVLGRTGQPGFWLWANRDDRDLREPDELVDRIGIGKVVSLVKNKNIGIIDDIAELVA